MGINAKEFQKEKQSGGNKMPSREMQRLLVFARCLVLWSHHAAGPLPLYGAAVVVHWVVVVGSRCGHHEHAGHIELYICGREKCRLLHGPLFKVNLSVLRCCSVGHTSGFIKHRCLFLQLYRQFHKLLSFTCDTRQNINQDYVGLGFYPSEPQCGFMVSS